jgi:hypothetical protein
MIPLALVLFQEMCQPEVNFQQVVFYRFYMEQRHQADLNIAFCIAFDAA